ncbi:hypothetical protein QR680_017775 [Steinernema hermaphroditum]|uniref:Chloride channel protein n=1 Tax=Steinernema hermaphroditum TaxID=289476 RepID=A0AA39HGZ1_9BILA|nr:hypothetical protein QR680_017775 [Steinernema hermaphroditum]
MTAGILKKEVLQVLDREYSYEQTVPFLDRPHSQIGRFRLEGSEEERENDPGRAAERERKIVRFHEHDPREEWKNEKRARTWGAQFKRWKASCKPAQTWRQVRMLLTDWLFLALLGIGMALCSMLMDSIIDYLQTFQLVLMNWASHTGNVFLDYLCTYLAWLGYTEFLVICSAMFVHYVAPQAIGSGIPEMKTILRGVILKDYLTCRTLISKMVGLTFALGSGIPIGKMGPFVHVASIVANLISNLAANFDGVYGNECRKSEMFAAACAVGVACTFSAPVGGVLFSIEVTTMYFSVRNYWRGFFAAVCGATVFRLLRVILNESEVTVVAFYQTHFPKDAFVPEELPFFALIGVICGFMGAAFIVLYRSLVMFLRMNSFAKRFFQRNWITYPIVVAFIVATITYPRGYGRFLTGRFKFTRTLLDFFSNCTWSVPVRSLESPHGCGPDLLSSWTNHEGYGPYNVFLVISLFLCTFFFLSALCNTIPVPCGMFMPVFVVGAALGRLVGEIIASIFPDGMGEGTDQPIFPGVYSVVGAAALSGSVTHALSVAVIVFELTGQLIYILPVMIAVIIANAISTYLQPSIYDSIIKIKHLPYLPDIPPSNSAVHMCCAENIMVTPVRYLSKQTTFDDIRQILVDMPKLRSFPVVDDPCSQMLLGSIPRRALLDILGAQLGDDARRIEAESRIRMAIETIDQHFQESQRVAEKTPAASPEATPAIVQKKKASFELKLPSDSSISEKQRRISESSEDRPIEFSPKPKRLSRFTIEPIEAAPPPATLSPATAKKKRKKKGRRNAVCSTTETAPAEMDDGNSTDTAYSDGNSSRPGSESDLHKMSSVSLPSDHQSSITRNIAEYVKQAKKRLNFLQLNLTPSKKEETTNMVYDLFDEERREWELMRLAEFVELDEAAIDPAPFQLVRKTSLYKVHSLFSMLDLNKAYVTDRGRLVGVVALRDLRIALQSAQPGQELTRTDEDESFSLSSSDDVTPSEIVHGDVESQREAQGEPMKRVMSEGESVKDILTPPLKIVHPSSASLHRFHNHPMLTIFEETEKEWVSRRSSVKSNKSKTEPPEQPVEAPTRDFSDDEGEDRVAKAVAYLRRKSLAPEEIPKDIGELRERTL